MALASREQRNATTSATSSAVASRLMIELGLPVMKTRCALGIVGRLSHGFEHRLEAFGAGRPGEHRVDGHAARGQRLREAAHQRQIRGFGEAVVDHFGRNLHAGFRGDEDDAAEPLVAHARTVMPGEAHAGKHIGREHPLPIFVRNVEGVLDLEHDRIVDQNIDIAGGLDDAGDTLGGGDIAGRRREARFGTRRGSLRSPARCPRPCGH